MGRNWEVRDRSRTSFPRAAAALLVLLAGLIHFWVAPEHFGESWQFGWFMAISGGLQLVNAFLLLAIPRRGVLLATVAGNLAIVGIFAWAYTLGLPLGPDPGQVEQLTPLGLACTLAEAGVVAAAGALLLEQRRRPLSPVPARPHPFHDR